MEYLVNTFLEILQQESPPYLKNMKALARVLGNGRTWPRAAVDTTKFY
jgi:hypothetical protein